MREIVKFIKDNIQGKTDGTKRSAHWPKVRAEHLRIHPECAVCDGKKKVEVHHKVPFHINPLLELAECNLITLCESKKGGLNCHLAIGHLGNYKDFNVEVVEDANYWNGRLSFDSSAYDEVEENKV